MITILLGVLTAGVAGLAGYANLTGRPMLTGEKNRLGISDSMWLAAGIAVTVAGAGILAGFWITLIGLVSGFVVIAICAAAIWFQQQSGDRLRRSFAPTALGLAALLYVVFLLTG